MFCLGELHLIFVISSHMVICWYQIPNHHTPGIFMSTRSHKLVAKYYIRHVKKRKTLLVNEDRRSQRKWIGPAVHLRFLSLLLVTNLPKFISELTGTFVRYIHMYNPSSTHPILFDHVGFLLI